MISVEVRTSIVEAIDVRGVGIAMAQTTFLSSSVHCHHGFRRSSKVAIEFHSGLFPKEDNKECQN